MSLQGAAKVREDYNCRRFTQHETSTHTYQRAHTHTHWCCPGDVWQMLFYIIIVFSIIPSLVGLKIRDSRPKSLVWLTVCLIGWLLVCLIVAYIVLMLVLGVIRSTDRTVLKYNTWLEMEIHWCCDTKRARGNSFQVRWGESRLLTGGLWNQTSLNRLWALPETHLLCSDLLCMHTVYVSFCLDWLWRKYIYFL